MKSVWLGFTAAIAPLALALLALAPLALALLAGCHSSAPAPRPGSDLPVTSSRSVALPGAVDAADAPKAPAVAEPRTDDLVEYRDPSHGVSFQYPSVWRPMQPGTGYLPQPAFTEVARKPLITQAFSPAGNVYADTVLSSLSFSYTAQPGSDAAACAALPGKAFQSAAGSRKLTYNGRSYTEEDGGDAGMCHQLSSTLDSTLQGSTCLLFERDLATVCPFSKSATEPRPLTANEQAALQRHLDAVMASVRIEGAGN